MKDIVIKKTSDESQMIVLQTDSETLDYQSRFTVMTLKDYDSLMFDCKEDLGVTNSKGTWTMKFTMNNVSITREVVIS